MAVLDQLDPETLSYIVGLFQGDGSLSQSTRNRGKLTYEISHRDVDIIDKLSRVLGQYVHVGRTSRTRDTNFKQAFKAVGLTIYDWSFRKELNVYVPYGKKAGSIEPADNLVPRHYIRGLTDADGSMGTTGGDRCFWSLCTASEKVKDYVLNFIENTTGQKKKISRNSRDGVYNIAVFDEDAQTLVQILYDDTKLFIDHKMAKCAEVLAWTRPSDRKRKQRASWFPWEDEVVARTDLTNKEKQKMLGRSASSIYMRAWRQKKL